MRATGTNWAVYAEDQFKPRQNLTITLGARVDREEITSEGRRLFDPAAELEGYLRDTQPWRNPLSPTFNPDALPEVRLRAAYRNFTGYEQFSSFESQIKGMLCDEGDVACWTSTQLAIDSLSTMQKNLYNVRRNEDITIQNTNVSPYISIGWDPFSNGKTAIKASAGRHYNNIPLIVPLQELEPAETDRCCTGSSSEDEEAGNDPDYC